MGLTQVIHNNLLISRSFTWSYLQKPFYHVRVTCGVRQKIRTQGAWCVCVCVVGGRDYSAWYIKVWFSIENLYNIHQNLMRYSWPPKSPILTFFYLPVCLFFNRASLGHWSHPLHPLSPHPCFCLPCPLCPYMLFLIQCPTGRELKFSVLWFI